jgi:hypothetical protein
MVGSYWTAILVLSALGLWQPLVYSPVFLLQLIYKGLFLVAVVLPKIARGESQSVPWGISGFFLAWCVLLPFAIPWRHLFGMPAPPSDTVLELQKEESSVAHA